MSSLRHYCVHKLTKMILTFRAVNPKCLCFDPFSSDLSLLPGKTLICHSEKIAAHQQFAPGLLREIVPMGSYYYPILYLWQ